MKMKLRNETLILLGFLLLALVGMAMSTRVTREGMNADTIDVPKLQARTMKVMQDADCSPGPKSEEKTAACEAKGFPLRIGPFLAPPDDEFWRKCPVHKQLAFDEKKGPLPFKWTPAEMQGVCAEAREGECSDWISTDAHINTLYDVYCGENKPSPSHTEPSPTHTEPSPTHTEPSPSHTGTSPIYSGTSPDNQDGGKHLNLKNIDRRLRRLEAHSGSRGGTFT